MVLIRQLLVGLATDYCVRATVLDARHAGLHVTVLRDAIAGIDAHAGDSDRAMADMQQAGAAVATLREWTHVVEMSAPAADR
jgi:nicotinamidase/pyrazinamidase